VKAMTNTIIMSYNLPLLSFKYKLFSCAPCKGIRNPTFFSLWNPESSPGNPESNLIRTLSSNFTSNHHLPPPLGVLYHHQHEKVFGHLACTSNMSTLQLGVFDSFLSMIATIVLIDIRTQLFGSHTIVNKRIWL